MLKFKHLLLLLTANSVIVTKSQASNVYELTPNSFDNLVNKSKYTWIVQFYSPSCIYCKRFEPEYELTADKLQNTNIRVGRIDAVQYDDFSARYNINSYPTIKLFHPGSFVPEDYHGPRRSNNIIEAAINYAQNKSRREYNAADVVEPVCPRVDTKRRFG